MLQENDDLQVLSETLVEYVGKMTQDEASDDVSFLLIEKVKASENPVKAA